MGEAVAFSEACLAPPNALAPACARAGIVQQSIHGVPEKHLRRKSRLGDQGFPGSFGTSRQV
jgi:hypothetical protein